MVQKEAPIEFEVLCIAAYEGDTEKFFELIQFIDHKLLKGTKNSRGQTLLYCAACGGSSRVISKLLKTVPDIPINGVQGPRVSSPLHGASWKGNADVVVQLIMAGANLTALNEMGFTPAQEAQKAAKFVFEVYERDGLHGLYPLMPKPMLKFQFTLVSCKGIKPLTVHGSSCVLEAHIKLTEPHNTSNIITYWKIQQTINNPNWVSDPYSVTLLDFSSIRINIRFLQYIENSENNSTRTNVCIGQLEKDFSLSDDQIVETTFDEPLENSQSEASIKCTLKTKPIDEIKMKKIYDKGLTTGRFEDQQVKEWYMKIYHAHHDLRSIQLKDSQKIKNKNVLMKKINNLSGSKKAMEKFFNTISYDEIQVGIVYPQLTIENFGRHWEALDVKEKFRHYLGFMNHFSPLVNISPLFETKYNFPPSASY